MTSRRDNNLILLATIATLFACVAAPPARVSAAEKSKADRIVEQNMFRRDRGRTTSRSNGTPAATPPAATTTAPPEPTIAPAPADPLATWVLRGMAIADGKPAAWIEDQQNLTITRLAIGDHVAGWKLHNATLDAIELHKDADTRIITVGQTLTGEAPATAPTAAAPGGAIPGESLLDRLRRRRLESLGQSPTPATPTPTEAASQTPPATPPANPAAAANPAATPVHEQPPTSPQHGNEVIAAPTLIIPNTGEEP